MGLLGRTGIDMTKNRKAKQAARAAKTASKSTYVQARRATSHAADAEPSNSRIAPPLEEALETTRRPSWRDLEPTMDERILRDLDWADVVLDCRRAYDMTLTEVPRTFPDLSRLGSGKGASLTCPVPLPQPPPTVPVPGLELDSPNRTSPAPASGIISVEAYALGHDRFDPFAVRGGKPGIVTRLTFPDGFRIGYLSWHEQDYDAAAEDVWRSYLHHRTDGFARSLGWACGFHDEQRIDDEDLPPVTAARHEHAVGVGALRVRAAVEDLDGWFGEEGPPEPTSGGHALMYLWFYATSGFGSMAQMDEVMPHLGDDFDKVMAAQDAGFDLANPAHRARLAHSRHWTWTLRPGPQVHLQVGDWMGLDRPDGAERVAALARVDDATLARMSLSEAVAAADPDWSVVGEVTDSHSATFALAHTHTTAAAVLRVAHVADFVGQRPARDGEGSGHTNGFRDVGWADATPAQRRHILHWGDWAEAESIDDLMVALARAEDMSHHDDATPAPTSTGLGWNDSMAHAWCLWWDSPDGRRLRGDDARLARVQSAARDRVEEVADRAWATSDRARFTARWDWCFLAVGAQMARAAEEAGSAAPAWSDVQGGEPGCLPGTVGRTPAPARAPGRGRATRGPRPRPRARGRPAHRSCRCRPCALPDADGGSGRGRGGLRRAGLARGTGTGGAPHCRPRGAVGARGEPRAQRTRRHRDRGRGERVRALTRR